MTQPVALVTNANAFAGPSAVDSLYNAGYRVVAHQSSPSDPSDSATLQQQFPDIQFSYLSKPQDIVADVMTRFGQLDVVVSNDVHPAPFLTIEEAREDDLSQAVGALVSFPFLLLQACLAAMKKQQSGSIIMVTSCRNELPQPGGGIADMARAASNALVKTASIEFAEHNIAVNAIAPNYYCSEAYFPRKTFIDGDEGAAYIRSEVPIGRLGKAQELGDLVLYLASLRGAFHTGSIIKFAGGWPVAKPRPSF